MTGTAPTGSAAPDLPIARRWRESRGTLEQLCGLLEHIADDLPHASAFECRDAARRLRSDLPAHHAIVAELIEAVRGNLGPAARRIADQVALEQIEDEGLAEEIASELDPAAISITAATAERLGYMLRCFFNGCRRTLFIESLLLNPGAAA
jgi:hypothetical protein